MSVPFNERQKFINRAKAAGIPPGILAWRVRMGFPLQHVDATDLVGDKYIYGKFEQLKYCTEKTEKNDSYHDHPPRHHPGGSPGYGKPNVRYKTKRFKKT